MTTPKHPTLPGIPQVAQNFDGVTYDFKNDQKRLTGQLARVYEVWASRVYPPWWTLAEIVERVGGSEAGVSARLRDLRKEKFGGHTVNKRHRGDPKRGLWEYQLERQTK